MEMMACLCGIAYLGIAVNLRTKVMDWNDELMDASYRL